MIKIQFSTSTAFSSGIIRRLTHSPWSHVDFVLDDGSLLGVSGKDDSIVDPGGVCIRPHEAWPYLYPPKVAEVHCTSEVASKVLALGVMQIGKPFDNSALWGFLEDQGEDPGKPQSRNWRDPSQWFCSELIIHCLEEGGVFHYPLVVAKNRISPADVLLIINPYLMPQNIKEFLP